MRLSDEQVTVGFARPDACGPIHGLYRCQKIDEGFPECAGGVEFHGDLRVTTDIIGSKTESIRVQSLSRSEPSAQSKRDDLLDETRVGNSGGLRRRCEFFDLRDFRIRIGF